MSIASIRDELNKIVGAVVFLIALTYCMLLTVLAINEDKDFITAFVAFAFFAQSYMRRYMDILQSRKPKENEQEESK